MEHDLITRRDPNDLEFQSDEDVQKRGIQPTEEESLVPPQAVITEKRYVCKYCAAEGKDVGFKTSLELARHTGPGGPHKDQVKAAKAEKATATVRAQVEQAVADTEEHIWADIRIRGPEALSIVLQKRLVELLETPGVDPASMKAAIGEWENDPTIHFDFRQLARMLISDAGIKAEKASRIVEKLEQLYLKYAPALQGGGVQGYIPAVAGPPQNAYNYGGYPYPSQPPPTPPYYQQPPWYQGQGGGPYGQPPMPPPNYYQQGYPPQRPLTMEDVDRAVEKAVDKVADRLRPAAPQAEAMAEVDWPVGYDDDGKQIFSKIRTSQSSLPFLLMAQQSRSPPPGQKTDDLDKTMDKLQEQVVKPLEERMRAAEEEAKKAREESNAARIAEADRRAADARKELDDTKKYVHDVEDRIRDEERNRNVEGYRSDSFKLVGQTASDVAQMVKQRRPLKEILDVLFPTQGLPPVPAQQPEVTVVAQETAEAARAGVIVAKDA
jgi:hypothetical protein